jgi:predicted DNA-binding transcriptional regulator YafY
VKTPAQRALAPPKTSKPSKANKASKPLPKKPSKTTGKKASKKPSKKPVHKKTGRYSPSRRLAEVRTLLHATGGASIYDIAERLGISIRTALRYLQALEDTGERLYEDPDADGRKKVWRVVPSTREGTMKLTTSQMVSLVLSRRVFDFLDGTGFKEDLEDVFKQIEATLQRKDFVAARHLDKKLYDVNEAPYRYEGRIDDVNDIVTSLLREDRLSAKHTSVKKGEERFKIDPYTLLVYKKGLYLAGYSHHHKALRTFALDGFSALDWKKGDRFKYPADYDPTKLVEGAFGLFGGAATEVKIFFSSRVARYVERRQWHPTQKVSKVPGGVELKMTVHGTVEIRSWVLGFGDQAEVIDPPALRQAVAEELARASERYSRPGSAKSASS